MDEKKPTAVPPPRPIEAGRAEEAGKTETESEWIGRRARVWILVLNSLGFALFLAWLVSLREEPIMREQEGILYFLPCLPFLFVYLMMMPRKKVEKKAETAEEEEQKTPPGKAESRQDTSKPMDARPVADEASRGGHGPDEQDLASRRHPRRTADK